MYSKSDINSIRELHTADGNFRLTPIFKGNMFPHFVFITKEEFNKIRGNDDLLKEYAINKLNQKIITNFEVWKNSDNVIKIDDNNYKTQCSQYSISFTEKRLEDYYKKEYCNDGFRADGFEHFKENFTN